MTFHITRSWEAGTLDWRARWFAGATGASGRVCLILLDQNSLNWGKEINGWRWPWPREIYGAIIDFCKRSGVKAVGMDILFTEPSFYGEDDDKALKNSILKSGNVAGAVFFTGGKMKFNKGAFPIDEIRKAYKILGNVNAFPDEDGVFRKTKPFVFFNGKIMPSLAIATYLAGESERNSKWNFTPQIMYRQMDLSSGYQGNITYSYKFKAAPGQFAKVTIGALYGYFKQDTFAGGSIKVCYTIHRRQKHPPKLFPPRD